MRSRVRGISASSLVIVMAAAFGAVARAQTPSAVAGTWTLDAAKSTFSPGPAPKSMSITYSPVKDGVRIKVDIESAAGAQHWDMTPLYDGKVIAVQVYPRRDDAGAPHMEALLVKEGALFRARIDGGVEALPHGYSAP